MTKINIFPFTDYKSNPYLGNMIKAIEESDKDIKIERLPGFRYLLKTRDYPDIAYLNWYENLPHTTKQFYKDLFARIVTITLLKLNKVKVITVFHNKRPHESKNYFINNLFFKFLLKASNNIVTLNRESQKFLKRYISSKQINKKSIVIPHPIYQVTQKKFPDSPLKFNILFFGFIRPYKNIELIIELSKKFPEIEFSIAGSAINEEYAEYIKKECSQQSNINLQLEYQTDEKLDSLIDRASLVILPYNMESSLNSGVVFYAFSKGINVIIPEITGIENFENKNLIYTYLYKDEKDHSLQLEKVIKKAYQDYIQDYKTFVKNSEILHKEVMSNNSLEKISDIIKNSGLLNKQK